MHTIVVPKEKRRSGSPIKEDRIAPEVALNLEATDSRTFDDEDLDRNVSKEGHDDIEKNKQNIRPPYVVWVQMMTGWEGGEVNEPLNYDPESRNDFVRKVFYLVFLMFVITTVVCVVFTFIIPINTLGLVGTIIVGASLGVYIVISYVIYCSPCGRKSPISYILLVLTGMAGGVMCASSILVTQPLYVYCALGATLASVLVCILLAFSSFDFTKYMLYIVMIVVALTFLSIALTIARHAFGFKLNLVHVVVLVVLQIANMVAFAMELQMILGGRTLELDVEDYAVGALMVYQSILQMFLTFMRIARLAEDI